MQARQAVLEALSAVFPEHAGSFGDETTAEDVSGWDSFSHVQLMFEIETRLGRKVEIRKTYDLENVGALIRLLEGEA
jgi:acyl carrier protein